MDVRKQSSTSYPIMIFMADSADHLTGKTGLTLTVTLSKNGGSFGGASGSVSEIANGWYSIAGNATDRDTLGDTILRATGTGADDYYARYSIVGWDPFATYVDSNIGQIDGSATAALRMKDSASQIIIGAVDDNAFTSTTTEFESLIVNNAITDIYKGRSIYITSGTQAGEATSITAYSKIGSRGHFTVQALTSALDNGDSFIII